MTTDLVIHNGLLPETLKQQLTKTCEAKFSDQTSKRSTRFYSVNRNEPLNDHLKTQLAKLKLDWAYVPAKKKLSDFKLIAFDMDSTLITIECIDELADFAGKKEEVAQVTEAAMRGELDYRASLTKRLALLAGLDARMLAQVFAERLLLSPGTRELLDAVHAAGLRTAILSGGFTYFTERLRIELGFDFATSNELEIEGGKLTGRVIGAIIDAQAKASYLQQLADRFAFDRSELITVGDGANDLAMMMLSGFSVAYQAKPTIQQQASAAINFAGLDGIIDLFTN